MDELRELYQATILDHNRKPRNFRAIDEPHRQAEGHNPVCGDRLVVFLELEEDRISDIAFQGTGCAISVASASLMTDYARGKTLDEIAAEFERFHGMVTSPPNSPVDTSSLGKLAAAKVDIPLRGLGCLRCAFTVHHLI